MGEDRQILTRVLVTGAAGLVGTWMLRTAPPWADITAATRASVLDWPRVLFGDLRSCTDAEEVVLAARPDVVIHAAYVRDRASITDATMNVLAAADGLGARFVLLSTDAVFDGDGQPRSENDVPDPVWDYGRWKVQAEDGVATRSNGSIVRLPLLVSLEPSDPGTRSIREAFAAGETVGWFKGERRQPALAPEVAAAIWRIVEQPTNKGAGIWHLAGAEHITRRELGARIAQALDIPDPGIEIDAPPSPERPHDLYLTDQRARDQINWHPSPVTVDHIRSAY